MSRWSRWRAAALALVMTGAGPAFAQGPKSTDEATRLFDEGMALMEAGHHQEACQKLQQSFDLVRGLGVEFNLARCYATIGRTATAHALLLEVADVSERTGQHDRAAVARARAAELEPKLIRLRVQVAEPVDGLVVSVDDVPLSVGALGEPRAVDPGHHTVTAVAPKREGWSTEMNAAGEGETLEVRVPALRATDASPSPRAPRADETPSTGLGPQLIAGIVTGVVGVAVLAAAGGVAIAAKKRDGEADAFCDDSGCDQQGLDIVADARALGNVATGLVVAGGVLAGAGLVVMLTAPSDDDASAMRWELAPRIAPETGGMSLRLSF